MNQALWTLIVRRRRQVWSFKCTKSSHLFYWQLSVVNFPTRRILNQSISPHKCRSHPFAFMEWPFLYLQLNDCGKRPIRSHCPTRSLDTGRLDLWMSALMRDPSQDKAQPPAEYRLVSWCSRLVAAMAWSSSRILRRESQTPRCEASICPQFHLLYSLQLALTSQQFATSKVSHYYHARI